MPLTGDVPASGEKSEGNKLLLSLYEQAKKLPNILSQKPQTERESFEATDCANILPPLATDDVNIKPAKSASKKAFTADFNLDSTSRVSVRDKFNSMVADPRGMNSTLQDMDSDMAMSQGSRESRSHKKRKISEEQPMADKKNFFGLKLA